MCACVRACVRGCGGGTDNVVGGGGEGGGGTWPRVLCDGCVDGSYGDNETVCVKDYLLCRHRCLNNVISQTFIYFIFCHRTTCHVQLLHNSAMWFPDKRKQIICVKRTNLKAVLCV